MSEQAPPAKSAERTRSRRSGRKAKSPAFQFYPADYLTDAKILALSFEHRGIWLHLICLAWLNDGIDPDTSVLARSCGLTQREFDRAWSRISTHFELRGERLVNPRQERERAAQAENRERRLAAGQLGNDVKAKKRAQAEREQHADGDDEPVTERCDGDADDDAMRTQCERNAHAPVSRLSSPVALRVQEDPSGLPPGDSAPGLEPPPAAHAKPPRKQPSGPQAELIRHFEAEWARTRPGVALVFRPREAVAAARLVKSPGLEEARRRVTWMLEDPNPWAIANASLSQLDSQPNRWAVAPSRASGAPQPSPGGLQDLFGRGAPPRPRTIETTGEVRRAETG